MYSNNKPKNDDINTHFAMGTQTVKAKEDSLIRNNKTKRNTDVGNETREKLIHENKRRALTKHAILESSDLTTNQRTITANTYFVLGTQNLHDNGQPLYTQQQNTRYIPMINVCHSTEKCVHHH